MKETYHGKLTARQEVGLKLRTLQRWTQTEEVAADARTTTVRATPPNALSEHERQAILNLCNSAEYAHLPPSQIVPRLADKQLYKGSESTFYRVLRAAGQRERRGRARRPGRHGEQAKGHFLAYKFGDPIIGASL